LGEVAVVDALADGPLVSNEVLALVAGGSPGALAPLGSDGVGDEVDVVLLASSGSV
jgi:hypothetical protein